MRSPFARIIRRSVKAGSNMVSQVVVSVAAAVCVGFITNAYLDETPAAQPGAAVQASGQPGVDASGKAAIRIVAAPMTSSTGRPARPLPASAVSVGGDAAEMPADVMKDPAAEVAMDGGDAVLLSASLPPLALQIVSDLPVREAKPESVEIFPGVPAESELAESLRNPAPATEPKRERRRFLGLPLPYVPSAFDLLGSATAAGERIVSLVER